MEIQLLKQILEAALMVAGQPLNLGQLAALFAPEEQPEKELLRTALDELVSDCELRGIELVEVASGYRYQIKQNVYPHLNRMWEEKPQRYSRALLETLALIAYRQPITRGEIEEVRGVSVSTNIIRTLEERDWIRVVGHRDVPGKPALYGTTRNFLDYFNLRSLDALPTLAELRDIDEIEPELALNVNPDGETASTAEAGGDGTQENIDNADATDQAQQDSPTDTGAGLPAADLASSEEDEDEEDLAGDLDAILAEVDQVLDSTAKTKQVTIGLPNTAPGGNSSENTQAEEGETDQAPQAPAATPQPEEVPNSTDESASDTATEAASDDTTGDRDHA